VDRSQEVAETRMRWLGIFSRADRVQMENQEKSCRREVHSLHHHLLWAPRKIVGSKKNRLRRRGYRSRCQT
jgi:hypothetical protein